MNPSGASIGDRMNLLKIVFKTDGVLLKSYPDQKTPNEIDLNYQERDNQNDNIPWMVSKHHQENIVKNRIS